MNAVQKIKNYLGKKTNQTAQIESVFYDVFQPFSEKYFYYAVRELYLKDELLVIDRKTKENLSLPKQSEFSTHLKFYKNYLRLVNIKDIRKKKLNNIYK